MTPSTNSEISDEDGALDAGINYAIERLCEILGVDPKSINWDAATETFDGDVMSVICNVLVAAYSEEWSAKPEDTALIREALSRRSAKSAVGGQICATEGCGKRATLYFEAYDIGSHYCDDCAAKINGLSSLHPTEPVAWVTADILAAMKRGERALPGWKQSDDFCIPLYAGTRPSNPVSAEVTGPNEMLVSALKGLVLLKDLFDASDRNQADALLHPRQARRLVGKCPRRPK
jgi:hypothetical protein